MMAYINCNKLCESEFDYVVSTKDKVQDINISQLKLKVSVTYKKDEKITTNFEASNPDVVISKGFLDEKLFKMEGHVSYMEKLK